MLENRSNLLAVIADEGYIGDDPFTTVAIGPPNTTMGLILVTFHSATGHITVDYDSETSHNEAL